MSEQDLNYKRDKYGETSVEKICAEIEYFKIKYEMDQDVDEGDNLNLSLNNNNINSNIYDNDD